MAFRRGSQIVTNGLVTYFDVANPKCVDATQAIDANTRLNNLAGDGMQMRPEDHENGSNTLMSFVLDNGNYVYDQDGVTDFDGTDEASRTASPNPAWKSTTGRARVDEYTFICWFKYTYGTGNQRVGENIYGGGFQSRTSFFLSPGGSSANHGALRYPDNNGGDGENKFQTDKIELVANHGANDNEWHMFATTDSGGDDVQLTTVYIDGVEVDSGTPATDGSGTHDTPNQTNATMIWGGWSATYGNFNGRSNCFMYYERALSASEILQNYNALKYKFI